MDYDYIVITDHHRIHSAYEELGKIGVPAYRIVTYEHYAAALRGRAFHSFEAEQEIVHAMSALGVRSVLDIDLFFAAGAQFTNNPSFFQGLKLYGYSPSIPLENHLFPIYDNLYEKIFSSEDAFAFRIFDAVLLTEYRTPKETETTCKRLMDCSRYIVLRFRSHSETLEYFKKSHQLQTWGKVQWHTCVNGEFCIVEPGMRDDIKIYVVMHKACNLPILSRIYEPIQAGKKQNPDLGFPGDDTGDEISEYNPWINELTALYWIWKNSSSGYAGLVHYRRYFLKNHARTEDPTKNLLDAKTIQSIFQQYDIILPDKHFYPFPYGNAINILWFLDVDIYERSLPIVRKWLSRKQPEYVNAFDFIMGHQGFYCCNMFVARKKTLDAYAEWIFSFLLDAVKDFEYDGLSTRQKRIMGYWGEILINVWLTRQHLRIKELPVWTC